MKKLILFLTFVWLATGCEKDFDGVVDANQGTNDNADKIVNISVPDSFYISANNLIINFGATAVFNNEPPKIFATLYFVQTMYDQVQLNLTSYNQNTANYSAQFTLDTTYHTGYYSINFYLNNKLSSVASIYIRGYNHLPFIYNLQMDDTVAINQTFIFSVTADDADGTGDIAGVYYNVYTPSGTLVVNSQGVSDFPLSDNGDSSVSGDEVANDQNYTMKLAFPTGSQTGNWKFDFFAIDKAREKSNIISHNILVRQ